MGKNYSKKIKIKSFLHLLSLKKLKQVFIFFGTLILRGSFGPTKANSSSHQCTHSWTALTKLKDKIAYLSTMPLNISGSNTALLPIVHQF